MDIITTLISLSLFFFFYVLGRKENNFLLELMGDVGIIIMAAIIIPTHIQLVSIVTNNITVDALTNTEIYSSELGFTDLYGSMVYGWFLFLAGFVMIFETVFSMRKEKKENEK